MSRIAALNVFPQPLCLNLALSILPIALAQYNIHDLESINGIDPTMDMPMNLAQGNMIAYLHAIPGDVLWFHGWVPGRGSTLFGACLGLFMMGVGSRWIAALRRALELSISSEGKRSDASSTALTAAPGLLGTVLFFGAPRPVLEHDWPRFLLHVVQVTIGFLFMLAVMTFQIGFILSIVVGLGVGEALYGRYIDTAAALNIQ